MTTPTKPTQPAHFSVGVFAKDGVPYVHVTVMYENIQLSADTARVMAQLLEDCADHIEDMKP